jgi:hypothetical protein
VTDAQKSSSKESDSLARSAEEEKSLTGFSGSKDFLAAARDKLDPGEYRYFLDQLSDQEIRRRTTRELRWTYIATILLTFGAIYLQGSGLWGFELPVWFLHWLGGATIGEVAVLLLVLLRDLF